MASVVSMRAEIEDAFWMAERRMMSTPSTFRLLKALDARSSAMPPPSFAKRSCSFSGSWPAVVSFLR